MVLPWLIFLAVAASLDVIYDTYTISSFFNISTISTSIYTVFSTFAGADFFIAIIMRYYLHKGKSMTGFSGRIKIIVGLMWLVVISGLVTSACLLSTLVAYIAWPSTLIYLAVGGILLKCACQALH
ncbi:hypothetical protein IW262DRAFT_1386051 [Armillaria fumosa]|nr:hypothetical protein IW262DRAFT_1386051 [Armillaria fumosa]